MAPARRDAGESLSSAGILTCRDSQFGQNSSQTIRRR